MKRTILAAILLTAAFFRFYNLANVPPSSSLDEASIGFNAYSILETGKDEYGVSFPLLLRAYDDFRPALYVYLTIPFVWLMGLIPVAVRLPSVILSIVTVYTTYLIGRSIGKQYLSFDRLGEIAAAILAVSPWHIYISRLGHEANLGLTLVTLGVYFFLKKSWVLCAVMFGLSLHGYQSEKVVTPLIALSGVIFFWRQVWNDRKNVVIAVVLGVLIALPAALATLSPEGLIRLRATSAFSYDAPKIGIVSTFVNSYISHFSPGWLFGGADREAHKVPGMGLLYFWEAPLFLLGLMALWKSNIPKHVKALLVGAIMIAPIPASFTSQAPHAMRAYTAVPYIQIIEAFGAYFLVNIIPKVRLNILALVIGVLVASGISTFWKGYFVRFPIEQSDSFQFALRPAVVYALQHEQAYKRIEFSHQGALYQSYMFFLFYSKFDPKRYLDMGGTVSGGFEASHFFGNYAFGFIPENVADMKPEILYFYDSNLVPSGSRVLERFTNMDGHPAIVAVAL